MVGDLGHPVIWTHKELGHEYRRDADPGGLPGTGEPWQLGSWNEWAEGLWKIRPELGHKSWELSVDTGLTKSQMTPGLTPRSHTSGLQSPPPFPGVETTS